MKTLFSAKCGWVLVVLCTLALAGFSCGCQDDSRAPRDAARLTAHFAERAWRCGLYDDYPHNEDLLEKSTAWNRLCDRVAGVGPDAVRIMLDAFRQGGAAIDGTDSVTLVPFERGSSLFVPLLRMTAQDRQKGLTTLVSEKPSPFRSAATVFVLWNLVQEPHASDVPFVVSAVGFGEYHASSYALYCLGFYDQQEARNLIEQNLSLPSGDERLTWATAAAVNMPDAAFEKQLEEIAGRSAQTQAAAFAAEALAKRSRQKGLRLLEQQMLAGLGRGSGAPALDALSRLGHFAQWELVADKLPSLEGSERSASLVYLLMCPDEEASRAATEAMTGRERQELPAAPMKRFWAVPSPVRHGDSYQLMVPPKRFFMVTRPMDWGGVFERADRQGG